MAVPKTAQPAQVTQIRVLPDGTVTPPPDVVQAAGFTEGETLSLHVDSGELRLVPSAQATPKLRKQPLVDLYNDFVPVREEVRESGISEEELFALIDEAIAASGRERKPASG